MKKIILFLLIIVMMSYPTLAAEPVTVNDVSTMQELLIAVGNTSIIERSDGYYTVYEPVEVKTETFTLDQNTRIDTYAFLDFVSNVVAYDCEITGFESKRKRRTDTKYIESGYIIVRNDADIRNVSMRLLGSEYAGARYNDGLTIYGNSRIINTTAEYMRYITIVSLPKNEMYWSGYPQYDNQYYDTTNVFENVKLRHAGITVYNSFSVGLVNCVLDNSKMNIHNYNNRQEGNISVDGCTFTDTNDRKDGDGHYSGLNGHWVNMTVSNTTFENCDLKAGNRMVNMSNCVFTNGNAVLDAARESTVSRSMFENGSVLVSRSGHGITITNNSINGGYYGIRMGTESRYGTIDVEDTLVSNNKMSNTTTGIAVLNAHGNVTIKNNTAANLSSVNSVGVLIESGSIEMHNIVRSPSGNTMIHNGSVNVTVDNTTKLLKISDTVYIFNNTETNFTHVGMNFTIHRGKMKKVYVYNVQDGAYNLTRNSMIMIENLSSICGYVLFNGEFDEGNYSISMCPHETESHETESQETESNKTTRKNHGRNEPLIVPLRNNTTIDVILNNTTIDVILNNTTTNITITDNPKPTVYEENETIASIIIRRVVNWISNIFKFGWGR